MRRLSVALLSLPIVFCGGQRFPFVRVAWSLGGLGFFVVLEVLLLFVGLFLCSAKDFLLIKTGNIRISEFHLRSR